MNRFRSIPALAGLVCLAAAAAAQPGKLGTPPDRSRLEPRPSSPMLVSEPPAVALEKGKAGARAVLTFRTARPVPAAACLVGILLPDQRLSTPRYRSRAIESLAEPSVDHRVVLELAPLARPLRDVAGFRERGGGTVAYRLEIYDPAATALRLFDGRFAFRGDRRVPCVVEGPFVDDVRPSSAVISWRTDLAVRGAVLAGGRRFDSGSSPRERHEVRLDGLTPGSTVEYRLEIGEGDAAETTRAWRFRTDDPGAATLAFAYFSDSRADTGSGEQSLNGVNSRTVETLTRHAYHQGVDLVLFCGDLINGYTTREAEFRSQLRTWKAAVAPIGPYVPIYESMGNHDALVDQGTMPDGKGGTLAVTFDKLGAESAEAVFADEFVNPRNGPPPECEGAPPYAETVYWFDRGHTRFVALNTNYWYSSLPERFGGNLEGHVMDGQLRWLEALLEKTAEDDAIRHVFVAAHEPAFPCGGHARDAQWYHGGDPKRNGGIDRTYVVKRRDELWAVLARTGKVVAVLFGDEHNYSRMLVDRSLNPAFAHPVWHIVSGGCGAPYYARDRSVPWSDRVVAFSAQQNYCLFRIEGSRVVLEVWGATGERIDRAVLRE